MKKIIISGFMLISSLTYSQIILGDEVGTAVDKTSVLLEFAKNQNRGIILPYVRTLPTGSALTEGTILLDATDATQASVRFFNGTEWVDLSNERSADVTTHLSIQPNNATGEEDSKVIIGAESSDADGILVLESEDKAMVLPMVEDTDSILNPAPGMMVYVNKESRKRLAVFNGNAWTYWRAALDFD